MRILIVEESRDFRDTLTRMLRTRWPVAEIHHWNPREKGHARHALGGPPYSVVLLDAAPAGEDGYTWTAEIRQDPDAPPVILIALDDGEAHAMRAMSVGASELLRRSALTAGRLVRSVEETLREQTARQQAKTGQYDFSQHTVQLDLRKLGGHIDARAQIVPGYRIINPIGRGGMAQVYLAERQLDRLQVALKVIDAAMRSDQVFFERFVREYQLIAQIQNEYVARIFDKGFTGANPYIAMEYLPSGTLAARVHEGLTPLAALRLVAQIAQALDAVHAHNIIHRDLKPANILFRANGRPVIVDFGLARNVDVSSDLTRHGQFVATPRYMSPEQCTGGPVDQRSDLYSLGVIFYEMLTGRPMFESEPSMQMITHHIQGTLPKLPAKLSGFQSILDRMLARDPANRYASARELFAQIAV